MGVGGVVILWCRIVTFGGVGIAGSVCAGGCRGGRPWWRVGVGDGDPAVTAGAVCCCGFRLPDDWPPAVLEYADEPGYFGVLGNLFLCAPCARAERIEP